MTCTRTGAGRPCADNPDGREQPEPAGSPEGQALGGLGGVILAGGRASRLGLDKAQLQLGPQTVLERIIGRLSRLCDPVVLCLAPQQACPALPPHVEVVRDAEPHQGPLLGVLQGMRQVAPRCAGLIVQPVDMPYLELPWLERLAHTLTNAEAGLYEWEGISNALVAAYRTALLPRLEALVATGQRRPMAFINQLRAVRLRAEDFALTDRALTDRAIADSALTDRAIADLTRARSQSPALADIDTPQAYREALLAAGLGNPSGAAVTLSWQEAPAPTQPQWLPLFAATPAEAVAYAQQAWPACSPLLERLRQSGRLKVTRKPARAAAGTASSARGSHPSADWNQPLEPGDALHLEGMDPLRDSNLG